MDVFFFAGQAVIIAQSEKPGVIVMTVGKIDHHSSMIRFLLYTNDVELLAIIEIDSENQREGLSEYKSLLDISGQNARPLHIQAWREYYYAHFIIISTCIFFIKV